MTTAKPIHVAGTPGTGKSAFSMYLLHELILKYPESAFVYRHGDVNKGCFIHHDTHTYFHPSITDAFSDGLLLKLLTSCYKRPIWTVLDGAVGIPTGTPEANMIVFTSPGQDSDALKHFVKAAPTIVIPPWSLDDIESLREAVYDDLIDANSVRDSFMKWGGIPRTLLDDAKDPEKQQELIDSIYIAHPETLFRVAGLKVLDHSVVSPIHFHLKPGEKLPDNLTDATEVGFRYPAYVWATTWVQERLWDELKNRQGELSIMNFLLDLNNDPTARAHAFEPHAIRTVENTGITGRCKSLNDTGSRMLKAARRIPALARKTFYDLSELPSDVGKKVHEGFFYTPMQTNHTSVDFYIPDLGMLVQVTVGQKHGVKRSGLSNALKSGIFNDFIAQNPETKLRLVFLCDKYNFNGFKKQKYCTTRGVVLKDQTTIDELDGQFDQFALELDVGKQVALHLSEQAAPALEKKRIIPGDWEDQTFDSSDDDAPKGGEQKGGKKRKRSAKDKKGRSGEKKAKKMEDTTSSDSSGSVNVTAMSVKKFKIKFAGNVV